MPAIAPDATTMSVRMGSSQMSSPSPAFSLDDSTTSLHSDPANLDINRHNWQYLLPANYRHSALGEQGVSIAGVWEFAIQQTPSSGMVTPSRPFPQVRQAYQHWIADEIRRAYQRRIADLREYGAEENVAINSASEQDFWAFIGTMPSAREAGLVLTPDGNLRAVWDDDNDADHHFAVQFLGSGQVQYVVFRRRPAAREVSRAAGTDTLSGVKRQIDAFDLGKLVYL